MKMVHALRIVQAISSLIAMALLLISMVSQVQGLLCGIGFIEAQQGRVAAIGCTFLALALAAYVVRGILWRRLQQRRRNSNTAGWRL